jgi:hypothetical protein
MERQPRHLPAIRQRQHTPRARGGQQFFANEEEMYQWIDWAKQWAGELEYKSDGS